MKDDAERLVEDIRRDFLLEEGADDELGPKQRDSSTDFLLAQRQGDGDLMSAIDELDMRALAQAIVSSSNKQNPHERFPYVA